METRTIPVKKTRVLKDGTRKTYTTKASYKVKNGVNDLRSGNARPKGTTGTGKLTPAQKEEVWTKYNAGVTIKRICADIEVSYTTVKKCIDKRKIQNVHAHTPPVPVVPVPVVPVPVVPAPVVPAPVVPAPVVPAHTLPAPIVPTPIVPAHTVPITDEDVAELNNILIDI